MARLHRYQRVLRRKLILRYDTCDTKNSRKHRGRQSDVVLIVKGTKFRAHRLVLLELSPYFRWSRPLQFKYTIPGVTPHIMEPILQFAYSKQIRITPNNVQDLLVAADYLLVEEIAIRCTQFLEKHLCRQNCTEIWRFADMLSLRHLSERALLLSELRPLNRTSDPSTKTCQKPCTRSSKTAK
ncbi:Kelch-like protein 10 [Bagarius yarrelli]|uniref:Kelch-like protein 10 n=1 Tax=Bagarius yarrelli TaxID=175774 RepID=A0A556TKF5_BAGYA|nr:Kelch-like protein 10 [Bagarius yarrelli]